MDGCNVTKSRVLIDSTVTGPVLQPKNIIVMGNAISTRTCALRGVADFTRVNGDWVAQIDPNTRDPKVSSRLIMATHNCGTSPYHYTISVITY